MLINADDFTAISTTLADFKTDVENKFYVHVKILPINNLRSKSADEVHSILLDECGVIDENGCADLEGAVMVGDVPYALYDQKYDNDHTGPFMFFYQDLDSTFEKNAQGRYYQYASHGAHKGPEIYLSWIKARQDYVNTGLPPESFLPPQDQLRNYFEKHHRYLSGVVTPSETLVHGSHCYLDPRFNTGLIYPLINLYGSDKVTQIFPPSGCDDLNPLKSSITQALETTPEVAYLHSHGSESTIFNLKYNDFLNLSAQPLFLLSWGCRNGSFYNHEESSTSLAFINGKDLGLSYLGLIHNGDIAEINFPGDPLYRVRVGNIQVDTFSQWARGKYLGKALLDQMQNYKSLNKVDQYGKTVEKVNLYEVSGPLQRILIGSPFVSTNSPPKYDPF